VGSKIYFRHGGTLAAATEEITDLVPYFEGTTPLIELGMSFQNGGASQGQFVRNPVVAFGTPGGVIAPHSVITWTEDASGDELWLARGRVSGEEEGRGIAAAEDIVEHVVTVDDGNIDLRGLAFTEDWVRPAETDTDRLYALDAYILSGNSSTSPTLRFSTDVTISDVHLAPDTNTVTMPAKTYPAGTQPTEVIGECATAAAKVYGVVIHHTGGTSHLCLLYILENDHATYASTVKVSDQIANWDPTDLTAPVLEPKWDQGKGLVFGGQAAISGLVSRYGPTDQFVYVNDTTREDEYEHWIDSYSDSDAQSLTEATNRATAILNYRAPGDFTYRMSLLMLPEQIHLIAAGMSIQVDTAVVLGGTYRGTYEDVRIVQLSWEPSPDGRYWAHLQLNRALRSQAPSPGKAQPAATTPTPAPVCTPDTVIAPTTVWHCTFTTDNKDDESSTYSFGLERTSPGSGAALAFFGNPYGRNNAGAYASQIMPWSAADDCAFSMDILWHFNPAVRNVDLYWYDVGSVNLLRVDRVISGAGRALDVGYTGLGAIVTPPPTAAGVQVYYTNFAGLYGDNIKLETPGSVVVADNDPFCVVDPGESPYYLKSDDPRFLDLVAKSSEIGYSWKMPVRVASTANGTLASAFSNGDSLDGVTLATGDRILLKDQTAGEENGIYVVSATGAPTRADDFASDDQVVGAAVFVSEGTVNGNTVHVCITDGPISLDTTDLVFEPLGGGTSSTTEDLSDEVHGSFLAAYHDDANQAMHLLASDDGVTFSTLVPDLLASSHIVRDPSIIHWDGAYWIVATYPGSTNFRIYKTSDLTATPWTEVVTYTDGTNTETWAPEWVRNLDGTPYLLPSTGFPCILFARSTDSQSTFVIREVHPTNRGMTAVSAATTVTGTSLPTKMIDPFCLTDGTTFYLWYKQESTKRIEYATSTTDLTSGYEVSESGDWAGWNANKSGSANSIEGPCVVRLDDGRWRIYFNENNGLNSIRTVYSDSTDVAGGGPSGAWGSWTVQTSIVTEDLMGHGSVVFIPSVYDHMRDPYAHNGLGADLTLDGLSDVVITSPAEDDALVFDGSQWVNQPPVPATHWEVLMTDAITDPPDPLLNEAGDDWLYGEVS